MPEEKKDSFTFSDKIKSSKAAGNKSFAKSSAKIGRDGKPKATLFERTRRDAPFFIAALVALLLLPFLYKYSGQANEDQLLAPGMESTDFDPERYGFDTAMVEDPDGQIAQLAGRDSLSLIKGWGSNEEEDYARDDMDLDASASYEGDAEGEYSAERHSSSDMDVEENTTNIYKRRARAGTRAAFRRTKILPLSPAGLRRPGGSRLGINNWGGGLKGAARKVGSGPTSAPKPVSLQPLRAAGPARSSFGQGAAQAARKGLDNMGKANAVEALRDSYVKPVDPTRSGGIDLFADGRTGGNGKLNHSINIGKGQTPWWWDMMKTRMQEEWMARFKRKWDWINFFDKLAQNILRGLLNCIITGDSDGDPDNFLGISAGGGTAPTCCGYKESDLRVQYGDELAKAGSLEAFCKGTMRQTLRDLKHDKSCGFKGGVQSEVSLGPVASRLKCLGLNAGAYLSGSTELRSAGMDCADMPNLYQVTPSGQARKWNTYIYVTARNYFPEHLKKKFPQSKNIPLTGNLLCAQADRNHGGDSLDMTGKTSQGVGHGEAVRPDVKLPWYLRILPKKVKNPMKQATGFVLAKEHIMKQNASTAKNIPSEEETLRSRIYELDQESTVNGCVIYVQRGDTFDYEVFKNKIIDQFKEWGGKNVSDKDAQEAFYQLDLLSVESFAAKNKLAYAAWFESGHHIKNMLPMLYWRFYDAYVRHKKITHKLDGSRDKVYKAKYRVEGIDVVYGPICHFDTSLMVECNDDPTEAQALVTFKKGYKGMSGKTVQNVLDVEREAKDNLVVTAQFVPLNGDASAEQNMHGPQDLRVQQVNEHSVRYTLNLEKLKDATGHKMKPNGSDEGDQPAFVGKIIWSVYRNARTQDQAHRHAAVSTATCTFNLSGDVPSPNVPNKECINPQQSAKCCHALMGDTPHNWVESNAPGSQCVVEDPNKNRPDDPNGPKNGLVPNDPNNPNGPKDRLVPGDPNNRPQTRLAPVLSWVPFGGNVQCREEAGDQNNPTEGVFNGCSKNGTGITRGQDQHCGSQNPLMMDSEAAAKFVRDVVTAYNKAYPNAPKKLSDQFYGGKYPTDGEFVDALYIAQELGIKYVPAAAVCELGRDMVRMSRDPNVGNKEMKTYSLGNRCPDSPYGYGQTNSTDKSTCHYTNDLGAFLTYVHPQAMFYPGVWVANDTTCDQRFIGTPTQTGHGQSCPTVTVPLNMHHNNYHSMLNKKKDAPESAAVHSIWDVYSKSLNPARLATWHPLIALMDNQAEWARDPLYSKCGLAGYKDKCTKTAARYKRNIELLLTEKAGFQAWQGNACTAFFNGGNGPDLKVSDVLEYVQTVCAVGLNAKPHGIGSSNMYGKASQTGGSHEGTGTSGNSQNPRM